MDNTLALCAFGCAALAGMAGDRRLRRYFEGRRWLRVTVFAAAFAAMAAIVAGGLR